MASVGAQVVREKTRARVITETLELRTATVTTLLDDSCRLKPVVGPTLTPREFVRNTLARTPPPSLLVVVTGVISNVTQYAVDGPMFGGISGVVYALAGYVWMRGRYDRASGLFLHQQSITILLVWLVVCYSGFLGAVANTAHLAGLAAGMAIGRVSAYLALRKPE